MIGPVFFVVRADVGQVEAFGHHHIELDGAALPGPSQGVLDMNIYFRAIKGAVTGVDLELSADMSSRPIPVRRWPVPTGHRSRWIFPAGSTVPDGMTARMCCKPGPSVCRTPRISELDLLRRHEDMGIILVKRPYAKKSD